ncbi:MAG: DUF2335 domain-containing protein [Bacteroidales bacterium]|nr:DUF2335 domain-containing protein [Bacteroidales bacterium]
MNTDSTDQSNNYNEHINEDSIHLPKELEEIIDTIPEDKKAAALKIISSLTINASSFRGPLPPPKLLGDYNKVVSDGAERIMKMAENQSRHRIELEKLAIKEELSQSKIGQLFGFILAIIGMAIAFVLAILGHDTVAGIFGTTTIIGLVTIFVIGKKKQKEDQDE